MFDGDQLFAIEMATPFGEDLIFDVQPRGPCCAIRVNRASDHLHFTKAGVCVGDDGQS